MRKSILIFLFTLLGIFSARAYDFKKGGIYYKRISNTSVEVSSSNSGDGKYSGSVVIPAIVEYGGTSYHITSIGEHAFSFCSDLTSVTIPESVTSIRDYAFSFCTGLTTVTLPESVISIRDYAFAYCSGLISVTIPKGVTSIGYAAFYACSGLTSVTISESVTTIGTSAFLGCTGLTTIKWNAVACQDFDYNNRPFNDNITSITFGNQVTHIPAYLCCGRNKLTMVTIPNSVTSIGRRAFYGCKGLTSVTISNRVTSIAEDAFEGCSALTSVTKPKSVTKDLRTELMEYFYPSGQFSSYENNPGAEKENGGTAITIYNLLDGDILQEIRSIWKSIDEIELISERSHKFSIKLITDEARLAIVSTQQNYRNFIGNGQWSRPTYDEILLFVLPPDRGKFVWKETVNGETYTCTAIFTDISFWSNGEKLYRKAVKISKVTYLGNGKQIEEWSYWVKGLSKLATYGYWGDPKQTNCIEKSIKIDMDKPIIEVSKK